MQSSESYNIRVRFRQGQGPPFRYPCCTELASKAIYSPFKTTQLNTSYMVFGG